jgi:hypothetical protein
VATSITLKVLHGDHSGRHEVARLSDANKVRPARGAATAQDHNRLSLRLLPIAEGTGSPSPMSVPPIPSCSIPDTSAASTTHRLRIAAAISGFYGTLAAAADPNNPNHAEAKEWVDD